MTRFWSGAWIGLSGKLAATAGCWDFLTGFFSPFYKRFNLTTREITDI
jgi:hypothetical protein